MKDTRNAELKTRDARFRVRRRVINYAREMPVFKDPNATGTKYPLLRASNLDYISFLNPLRD